MSLYDLPPCQSSCRCTTRNYTQWCKPCQDEENERLESDYETHVLGILATIADTIQPASRTEWESHLDEIAPKVNTF